MKKYDVAAYVWPSYHYEPRAEQFWPEKDGEWYTVRRGTPRFPGHDMPRYPLLGYQDEADPAVARQHVELAAKYGVNTFIMDWYWYENAPCFERQLNEGLIPALKNSDSKFYLMWANHDADTLWNMHTDEHELVWDGKVSRKDFEPMMERVIDKYFTLDSYYTIDGKPVFSIFSPANLIVGLGGVEETRDALDWLREKASSKGFPGVHIQFIVRRGNNNSPESAAELKGISYAELPSVLGVDSGTSYQFVADAGFNHGDYVKWSEAAIGKWAEDEENYPVLFPHVSIGWDNTQRNPSIAEAIVNATPDAFEACLYRAKMYIDSHPDQVPLITLNSWNEWTEGSYLLPDMRWGYRYLEAVKKVFSN
jgi:hypothetical protein